MAKASNGKNNTAGRYNTRSQTFSLAAPTAASVELVGSFTHWQAKPIQMQKGLDGVWRSTVELTAGAHAYRFIVDGQWHDDPECALHAPNPYGTQDAIRQVA
ncbi:MAG TPA: isoamylase early set domain-containing protein [Verrucomicrobiae bacterium]|nr:isoamylase early set domain-containing protein [Verrucomicrobiae bacterium]